MLPILFYGVPEGCSFGSIVALEWSGMPYRLCRIQMPETVSGETYRQVNPVGETPSLATQAGEVLSESMAILHHIGARAIDAGLAYKQGSPEFDRLNAMLAFLNTSFFNAFSPLWHTVEHDLAASEKKALSAYGRARVEKAHADLDRMLRDREWLLGDRRTLADAYFVGIARWNDVHKAVDQSSFPNVERIFSRLQDESAVRFAYAIEHREPAESAGGFAGQIELVEALNALRVA